MTKHLLTVLALLSAATLGAPRVGHAQAFKVEKFDIKGDGGTDYVAVEAATGRVFVSRATHMMVIEGATGKVLGDIPNTPGVHGAGLATRAGHGFTTNSGDNTVTMFDLKTLAVLRQIKVGPGLDGIMYDEPDDKIILTNHSRPIGTLTAIDPKTGDIVATVDLEDTAPEGAAADGKGHIFVNNEEQEHDPGDRRQDVEGNRLVAARAVRRADRYRVRHGVEPHFRRLQQDVRRRRCEHGQSRGVHRERHARRCLGMGSVEEVDLHSKWGRGQRHGRPPGFTGQVHSGCDRPDVCRSEDDRRRSGDAQRLPLPARARSGSGAAGWSGTTGGRTGRAWPRSAGPDRRLVVHRHHAVATRRVLMKTAAVLTIAVAVALAVLSAPLVAQERKPEPRDSVRVSVPGCTKGYVFTAVRRTEDEPGSVDVPEGMHVRMNGPKKLMAEIKAHEGSRIEITGLMKRGQFGPEGVGIGGGVRITPGPTPTGGSQPPIPFASQAMIDVEGWRPIVGSCPSH